MTTTNEKILTGALIVAVVVAAVAVVLVTQQVRSRGHINVTGFEAFTDNAATIHLSEVDWGNLNPGEVAAFTFYAKNTGNTNITLAMNSTAWQPANAEQFISYSWDYNGQILVSKQVLTVTLFCTVAANIDTSQPLIENFESTINMNAAAVATVSGSGIVQP